MEKLQDTGVELRIISNVLSPKPLQFFNSNQKQILIDEFLKELDKYKDCPFHSGSTLTISVGLKF